MVRSPMQVDDEFRKRIKKIQEEIMKRQGEFRGAKRITGEIIKTPEWTMIERRILGELQQLEFKINFDRRKKK